jgi:peptide/nickel transport system permease protein
MPIQLGLRLVARLTLTVLVAGLLGASLVRYAPGFGVDEQELDSRLNGASVAALRASHSSEKNILSFYAQYLVRVGHGDLGTSRSLGRPVSELFRQRFPYTLRSVSIGLLGGWLLGFGLALPGALSRHWAYDVFSTLLSGLFLCLPAAVLALFFLYFGGAPAWAISLIIFPRIFRFSRNLIVETYAQPHIVCAKARGLGSIRLLISHVLRPAAPQLLALAGVSVSMAVGSSIPVEVVCDSPGLGQLAWQAALGRDLPLLVNITLLIAVITLIANSFSDFFSRTLSPRSI